jgi:formylglycine-generating enzyme required for sulfatase activity
LQWAARAGESGRYPESRAEKDNFRSLERFAWTFINSRDRPQAVGRLLPNAWGLFDVLGNADEMTSDWRGDPPAGLHIDFQGPPKGTHRVLYGGGYNNRAVFEGTFGLQPGQGTSEAGFRIVREP